MGVHPRCPMDRQPLPGSARALDALAEDPDPLEVLRLTLHLRPAEGLDPAALMAHGALPPGRRPAFPASAAARPEDLEAVRAFAADHGLALPEIHPERGVVVLEGPAEAVAAAFGLTWGRIAGRRVPLGELSLPAALAPRVAGVLGLDARPRLRPHVHHDPNAIGVPGATDGYILPELAARYAFPEGTGRGQRVGLIELGGGYRREDLQAFCTALDVPVPTVREVSVLGAVNTPDSPLAERLEVTLDLQVVAALVPEAELVIYFAPNTDAGFMEAVQTALDDPAGRPDVLSISWGSAETHWSALDLLLFDDTLKQAAAAGMTVIASAGDAGSRDGIEGDKAHVNFPASSVWVLGCGGTCLSDADEVVWNSAPDPGATGGGISDLFELPAYQKDHPVPPSHNDGRVRRGVPDVAADADRATGYRVFVDGAWAVIGGTSAAAPLWAALLARCNAALGAPCGFLHPYLYGDAEARAALTPILVGNNGDYHAQPAYSACTGLGSPDGAKLLAALRGDHLPPGTA